MFNFFLLGILLFLINSGESFPHVGHVSYEDFIDIFKPILESSTKSTEESFIKKVFTTTESTQPPVINIIGSNEDKSLEDLSKDDILQLLSVWIPKLNATTKNSTPVAESTEEPCDITETSITHSGGSYVTKESSGSTITSAKETYVTAPSTGITYDISGTSNEIQYSSTGFTEEQCDTTETEDLGVTVDAKLSTVIINNSEEPLGHKEIKSSTDANKDSVIDFVSLWMEKLKTTTYAPSVVTLLSAEPHDATKISSVTSTLKEKPDYITKTSIKSTRSTEYVTINPVITDHKSEEIETTTTSTGKPYIITNTPTRTLEPTFTTTTKSCQEPCDTTDSKNLNIHNPQSSTATNYDSEEPSGSSENENSTDISKDDVLDFLSIWMSKLKTTTKSPIIITEPYGTTKTSIEGTKPFIPTESLIHDTETTSSKPTKYVNTNYPPLTISSEELNDTENLFEITTTSSTRTKTTYEPNSAKDIFSITTESCKEPCDTKTTDSINFITDNSQLSTAKINHDSEEPFEPSSTDINEDNILDFLSVWLAKLQTTTQPPIIITELSENPYDTTNISTMKTKLTEEIVTSITESIEESRDTIITQSPEEKVGTNDAIITTISKQFYDTSKNTITSSEKSEEIKNTFTSSTQLCNEPCDTTGFITINNPIITAVTEEEYDTTKTFIPTTTSTEKSYDITIGSTTKSTYEPHDITNNFSTKTETCEGPCGALHDTTKTKIPSTEVENNTGSITINNPLIAAVPGKVYDTTKTFVPTTTSTGESDDITIVSTSKSTYEAHDRTNHISITTESCKDPCDNTNGINLTSVNSQSSIEVNDNSGILVNVNEVIQKIIAKITGILLALPSKILQIVSAILPVVVRIIEVFSGFDLPYN